MNSKVIKIGDLVAVRNTGLYSLKVGAYIFGHVTDKQLRKDAKDEYVYYVMWDNGNEFWYGKQEIQNYKNIINTFRNS
jgi:hypothetical protein